MWVWLVGEYVALHCFEFQRFGDIRVWVARAGRARVGGLTRPWHRERERERERSPSSTIEEVAPLADRSRHGAVSCMSRSTVQMSIQECLTNKIHNSNCPLVRSYLRFAVTCTKQHISKTWARRPRVIAEVVKSQDRHLENWR